MALDKEAARKRAEELQKGEGEFSYLKLDEGKHRVRILPAWNDSGIPWKETYFHYGVNEKTLACPKAMIDQPCPVCDLVAEAAKSPKKGDKKLAQEMSAKFRAFFNVLDMENVGAGIQVWPVGKMILKQVLSIMGDPDYEDITSTKRGHTLIVEVEGSGRNTRYTVRPRPKPSKIPDSVDLSGIHDLDKIANIHTPEYITAVIEGDEPEEEDFMAGDPNYVAPDDWESGESTEEEAEEEKPKRVPKKAGKPAPKRKPKAAPAEEEPAEEETAEEEAPEEEAAEEAPAEEEAGEEEAGEEEAGEEAPEEEAPEETDKTASQISSLLDKLKKKKK